MRRWPRARAALLAIAIVLALAACDAAEGQPSGGGHPRELSGTSWSVVAVGDQAPVPGSETTIGFADKGVSGSGGCNRFSGTYSYDASTGQLELSDLAMTAMACADDRRNRFETVMMRALQSASRADLEPGGRLWLSGPGGLMVLEPKD